MAVKWKKEIEVDEPDTYTAEQDGYTAIIIEDVDDESKSELEITNESGKVEFQTQGNIDACKKAAGKWLEPEEFCDNCGWRGDSSEAMDDIYGEGRGHKYCPECELSL